MPLTDKNERLSRASEIRHFTQDANSAPFLTEEPLSLAPALFVDLNRPTPTICTALSNTPVIPVSGAHPRYVANADTISAMLYFAQQGYKPCGLVFGSARRAGGGWENGAKAQEEDISLHSTWALHAEQNPSFYEKEKTANSMNSDALLIAKEAYLLADPTAAWLDIALPCSFIGFAAPNARGLSDQGIDVTHPTQILAIKKALKTRMLGTLNEASQMGSPPLVLGAIGCGVFKLDPQWVAQAWCDSLKMHPYQGTICFAIPHNAELRTVFSTALTLDPAPFTIPYYEQQVPSYAMGTSISGNDVGQSHPHIKASSTHSSVKPSKSRR